MGLPSRHPSQRGKRVMGASWPGGPQPVQPHFLVEWILNPNPYNGTVILQYILIFQHVLLVPHVHSSRVTSGENQWVSTSQRIANITNGKRKTGCCIFYIQETTSAWVQEIFPGPRLKTAELGTKPLSICIYIYVYLLKINLRNYPTLTISKYFFVPYIYI